MKPIILTPLQSGNPCLSEVVSLYEKAFPLEERRPTDEWLEKNSSSDLFTINLLESDGQTLGFITIWQFEDFAYVEHFAVDEKQRGNGIGAAAISALRAALITSSHCSMVSVSGGSMRIVLALLSVPATSTRWRNISLAKL